MVELWHTLNKWEIWQRLNKWWNYGTVWTNGRHGTVTVLLIVQLPHISCFFFSDPNSPVSILSCSKQKMKKTRNTARTYPSSTWTQQNLLGYSIHLSVGLKQG
jgi:hypothetical protein